MVKDFTKEDIPVLGRLVSISDDNTVANAEQIWDAKNNQSIQDTVNDFDNRITSIEGGSSLTQEQKNILRFIQEYSTIYQYAEPDSYDDAFDVNNLWLRYDNANLEYKNSSIDISGDSCLSIWSRFNSNYGNTSALYINVSKASDVTAQKWAIQVTGGDCKFKDDLMVEGTIRSIEGFETQEGSVTAWDGIFENSIISQGGALDRLSVGGNSVPSGDAILTVEGLAYFEDGFHSEGDCLFGTNVTVGGNATFQSDIILNGSMQVQPDQFFINDTTLDDYIAEKGICVLEYDQEIDEDTLRKISSGQTTVLRYLVNTHGASRVYYYPEVMRVSSVSNLRIEWARPIEINSNTSCNYYSYILQITFNGQTNNISWSNNSSSIDFLTMLEGKQNTLSAGSGISIDSNNVISCTVSGGGSTEGVIDPYYVHTDNNYTTAEKNKLAGIPADAEANIQSNWNETDTSSDAYILNKPTALSAFTNDMQFVTMSDISTAGAITATDIAYWNAKADAATSLSGYNIPFDERFFWESPQFGFTFTDQYTIDHPVKMTQAEGATEWSTVGDNKVPTVGAVYNKFLAKDDSTVVKTVGDQTIDGNKTFNKRLNVLNLRSTESNTQSSNKFFATDGTIGTFKTINNEPITGAGNINIAYSNFTSPSNNAAGIAGLVPAPAAGTQDYILSATGWKNMQTIVDAVAAQIQSGETWILSNISIRDYIYQDYDYAMCVTNTKDNKKYLITSDGDQRGYPICGKLSQYGVTWTQDGPTKKDEYTSNYYPEDMVTDFNLDGILSYDAFSYLITG